MPHWLIWVIVGGVLAVGEILTLAFILGPLAIAAFVSAILAATGANLVVQLIAFGVVSLLTLIAVQPIARRHRNAPAGIRTGVAALVGSTGIVTRRTTGTDGAVKLSGEIWSARSREVAAIYEEGTRVVVVEIDGATAVVTREGSL